MATKLYSSISVFPATVTSAFTAFSFDDDSVSASSLTVALVSGAVTVTTPNGVITFSALTSLAGVLKGYFTFADGSQLVLGDGLSTIVTDATVANTLLSTDGSDYLDGLGGGDTASYVNATGAVTVSLVSQGSAQDTIGAGSDKLINIANLTGSNFNDTLTGDANANVLDGGAGIDTMDGGLGADTYKVTAGDIVTDSGTDAGIDTVIASADYALAANSGIESLTLLTGSSVAVYGSGNASSNTVTGNGLNNVLDGGSAGTDILAGGLGNDTYIVSHSSVTVSEATGAGTDTVISSVNYTLSANVEVLKLVGAAVNGTGSIDGNTIIGNSLNNTLDGGVGSDKLTDLLGGNDTLIGGTGADILQAGTGNDTLWAGVLNTTTGDSAADSLYGGSGNDTYYVTDTSLDVVYDYASITGTDTVNAYASYALNDATSSGVEILTLLGTAANGTGNSLANTITGNSSNNTLDGGAGNDTITDSSGTNVLIGGTGADTITGGTGADTLWAGALNATTSDSATDHLTGGAGSDTYYVNANQLSDIVTELTADSGTDLVKSTADYSLATSVGAGIENLTLLGATAKIATGNALDNTITANAAGDTLVGGAGSDTLVGGSGADKLYDNDIGGITADASANTMSGGAGADIYYVNNINDITLEKTADAGIDEVRTTVSFTLTDDNTTGSKSAGVESLTLYGSSAVNGTGNSLANTIKVDDSNLQDNTLSGGSGADVLTGGVGDDTLVSGLEAGTAADLFADKLTGGDGDDTYVINSNTDTITETATTASGTDLVLVNVSAVIASAVTYTLAANVEDMVLGTVGGVGTAGTVQASTSLLNATGNALGNNIAGNASANIIIGGAGSDTLFGGAGADTLYDSTLATVADSSSNTMDGGDGADLYYVTNTGDTVSDSGSSGTDVVSSIVAYTLVNGNGIETLTLTGTAAVNATGNSSDNTINGNTANNTLTGNAGNDILKDGGGTGVDKMNGGAGDDTYYVNNTSDTITESSATGSGTDSVISSVNFTLNANVENLTLIGANSISGTGNGIANTIIGNTGANILSGGNGDDSLNGKAGKDALTGGDGADTFVFGETSDTVTDSSSTNFDTISDFSGSFTDAPNSIVGENDVINLSGLYAAGSLTNGGFVSGTPTGLLTAHSFEYYSVGTNVFIIADTDGTASTIEFKVELVGYDNLVTPLAAADFIG
ncbi:calcium-binding protein [Methylovulum psychrotolerans]|uniref:beta strand repeat-containing protein n=1 Tax=Methylovulum psychrotolerans TaxID=1704499 RepID=UPI001BFF1163|nr:calcium-binding protein [Methylovulum psychrotolerans]MBT9098988.1 calcium-binding protein [Methylovulum psychrotolerans]